MKDIQPRWEKVPLGKVAILERTAVPGSELGHGTQYIGLEHIERDSGTILEYLPIEKGDLKSNKFRFTQKHVLYGKLRPYLNKVCLPDREGVCSTDIIPMLPQDGILDRSYLFYFLRSSSFVRFATLRSSGANLPRVSPKLLEQCFIPLPPLPVQKKIAAILEKADQVRRKRQEALRLTDQFLQSAFLDMFGDPVTNPKGWEVEIFSNLVSKEKHSLKRGPFGGTIKKEIFVSDGFKVYEQKNAIHNDFNLGTYFITEEKYKQLISFAILPKDLIISCSGTIGKVAIVPSDAKPGIINQALLKIHVDTKMVIPIFMKFVLETDYIQNKLFQNTPGSAIKNVVPLQNIRDTQFYLPPLSVQRDFANLVEKIKAFGEKQLQSEQELETLFHSLMQKAFSGELIA